MLKRKTIEDRIEQHSDVSRAIKQNNKAYDSFMYRLYNRFKIMLLHEHKYFITWTISEDYYNKLSPETLARYIKKQLQTASSYVFNSDYGKSNERLHFHGVATFDYTLDYSTFLSQYKYGAIKIIPIYSANDKALTKYILKLQQHAIKGTALELYRSRAK